MAAFLTFGHSNHALPDFLALLRGAGITALADVRSQPTCRFAVHFDEAPLRDAVESAGIRFVWLGDLLGGRPEDDRLRAADGRVLFDRAAESGRVRAGVGRLERGAARFSVAVMCAEEDPVACHRRLLVGRALQSAGHSVSHLRGDGRVQPEAALAPVALQQALFGGR